MKDRPTIKIRNSNIEVLRFILMILIFVWHLLVHGCDFKMIGLIDYQYNIYLSIVTAAITAPCVNCFMFISGWYGMKIHIDKLLNLTLICILSGLICLPINKMTGFSGGGIGYSKIYTTIFPISTKVWWFMTAYIMVYLVSPFIEKGMEYLSKKEILYILIAMTLIEVIGIPREMNWGSSFFGLLYVYMVGRFLKLNNINLGKRQSIFFYISMTLILIGGLILLNATPIKKSALFWSLQYNNPIIVIQAISLFFIVKNIRPRYNKYVNLALKPCLCIYLLPELLTPYKFIVHQLETNLVKGCLLTCAVILGCLLIGHLIFFVANKIISLSETRYKQIKPF